MKKVIACMLAALMLAAMLAGCGQQAADDAAPDDTAANTGNTLADGVYTCQSSVHPHREPVSRIEGGRPEGRRRAAAAHH